MKRTSSNNAPGRLWLAALTCTWMAGPPATRGQVVSNPNQVRGRIEFANTDPEILGLLDDALLRGISEVATLAEALPPADAFESRSTTTGTGGAVADYEVTVESSELGTTHLVQPVVGLGATDRFAFDGLTSPAVYPEPAEDVVLDFLACAALARLSFVDELGEPVTVDDARIFATPGQPANASGYAAEAIVREPLQSHRLLVPTSPDRVTISVGYDINGWDRDESFRLDGGLACDQVIDLSVVVPNAALETGSVTGWFDLQGMEVVPSPDGLDRLGPAVVAHGYRSNDLQFGYVELYGADVLPSTETFLMTDMVASDVLSGDPFEYSVWGAADLLESGGLVRVRSPSTDTLVPTGATVDLSDALVFERAELRGTLRVVGPDPAPGLPPILSLLKRAASSDEFVLLRRGGSKIRLEERDYPSGIGIKGTVDVEPAGSHDPGTGALVGDFFVPVPVRPGQVVPWRLLSRRLQFLSEAGAARHVDADFTLRDEGNWAPEWDFTPGSVFEYEEATCAARVTARFRSEAAPLFEPWFRADGSFLGDDSFGTPRRYRVWAEGYGTPTSVDEAGPSASVVGLLPVGDYSLWPTMKTVSPTGGISETSFPAIQLSVGCRQAVELTPDAVVHLSADLPTCVGAPSITVEGEASSTLGFESISIEAGRTPPVVVCTACAPVVPFSQPVTLEPGSALVRVVAVAANGDVATVEAPVRYLAEPSARDLRPASEPMRLQTSPSGLRLTWEWRAEDQFNLYSGGLDELWSAGTYDHGVEGDCRSEEGFRELPLPTSNRYFLVASDCGAGEGSVGRDSAGLERPPGGGCR